MVLSGHHLQRAGDYSSMHTVSSKDSRNIHEQFSIFPFMLAGFFCPYIGHVHMGAHAKYQLIEKIDKFYEMIRL